MTIARGRKRHGRDETKVDSKAMYRGTKLRKRHMRHERNKKWQAKCDGRNGTMKQRRECIRVSFCVICPPEAPVPFEGRAYRTTSPQHKGEERSACTRLRRFGSTVLMRIASGQRYAGSRVHSLMAVPSTS